MRIRNTHRKSFSFIEILIVVAIITFFSGLTLAAYNNYSEEQRFEVESKKLGDVIELAKKKASSGDIYSACTNFEGYAVEMSSATTYLLRFCCDGNCNQTVQSYSLASNVFFDSNSMIIPSSVQFTPLTISIPQKLITFKNKWLNKCRYLKIETSGIVDNNKCSSYDTVTDRCNCP